LYHVSLPLDRLKDAAHAIMRLFLFPFSTDWFFQLYSNV